MENDLAVRRAKHELTQSDLADAVGVSRQTISAIEGGRYNPSLDLAFRFAQYFDCSIEDIFEPTQSD
ncbi:helix-turn-helix transcriptional regulator [Haloprofundus marisrubri]|uniref:helix-turn-helix transcriptional regulator n=1 Tax=Haloprofundus marisrubri TaxID=1514971 RepID=UPI0009E4FE56|nr:helix-turn-helix transcriptional regulator [Haloprofundus marisrubri]